MLNFIFGYLCFQTLFADMVVTAITSFAAPTLVESAVENLTTLIDELDHSPSFVIGTRVQELTTIQLTSSWPSIDSASALRSSLQFNAFTETVRRTTSSTLTTTIVSLTASSPSSSINSLPFVEWVKIDFPAKDITPVFQSRIESDFARFEAIFRQRGAARELGEGKLFTGWAEEQDGVRSFVVSREWERMSAFEEAVETEAFKDGVAIMIGWGAPFSLVS